MYHIPMGPSAIDIPHCDIGSKDSDMDGKLLILQRRVTVHVTFLKLGEINTLKEQFDADILVRAKWREPRLDAYKIGDKIDWTSYWNPKLFIDNVVGEPKFTSSCNVEMHEDGDAWVTERRRYKGAFMETLELWEFPFDVQDLSVTVMTDLPIHEVEIMEDPQEIHKIYKQSFIDEQEWYLYKYIESHKKTLAKDRADPTVKRMTLTVRCRAARRPAYFIWNIFSVTLLIAALSFVTFAVDPNLVQNRLQLTFTLVLTTVAFKFVVNQSLPRISYLTYLDRYVLATMVVLAAICLWHGLQRVIPDHHKKNDWVACLVFLACYIVYTIQFLVRIILVPYAKRRDMKKKEQAYIIRVSNQSRSADDSDSESEGEPTKFRV